MSEVHVYTASIRLGGMLIQFNSVPGVELRSARLSVGLTRLNVEPMRLNVELQRTGVKPLRFFVSLRS